MRPVSMTYQTGDPLFPGAKVGGGFVNGVFLTLQTWETDMDIKTIKKTWMELLNDQLQKSGRMAVEVEASTPGAKEFRTIIGSRKEYVIYWMETSIQRVTRGSSSGNSSTNVSSGFQSPNTFLN